MREESGDSKGVGFCRVDSDKLCARIIQELHSRPFPGRNLDMYSFFLLLNVIK